MCNPQKKGVNCLLLLRLPANRRLLVVKFLVSQKLYVDIDCIEWGAVKTPKLHIFQASTVFDCFSSIIHLYHEGLYVIWDGGDGCTTIRMYLMPVNYTLKIG